MFSLPASMKKIRSKNEGARVDTAFSPIITLWELFVAMETRVPILPGPKPNAINPHPNDASDNLVTIGPLVAEIFEFENVYARTHARTDARTPDRPVYYKLTFEPSAQVS